MDKLLDLLNAMDDAAARWSKAKYAHGLSAPGSRDEWESASRKATAARNDYERARIALRDAIEAVTR